jgi:hypothetical protein
MRREGRRKALNCREGRLCGLPSDAGQRTREENYWRAAGTGCAGSTRYPMSFLRALPLPWCRRGQTSQGRRLCRERSRGREGLGGAGTKEPSAPHCAGRAAHLAPGTRHLLGAVASRPKGVGLEKDKSTT